MRFLLVLSWMVLFGAALPASAAGQADTSSNEGSIITFRFVPGEDMFYIPWGGNNVQLSKLYALVDEYRSEIASGQMPVYVDSYTSSMGDNARNLELAFVRANRVKSELIMQKGLVEGNFITKNHVTAYTASDGTSYKDMVVVTLRIPVWKQAEPKTETESPRREESPAVADKTPEPVRESEPVRQSAPVAEIVPLSVAPAKPYRFAIRSNLLYDASLLPTLGVEWRATPSLGLKLDGSLAWWGGSTGKVQKMWLVSPEVRWYMGNAKRFYVGVGGNYGEYNIYKGMLGGLFSGDTGYQGKLWNAGLTAGYQLPLSCSFSLDFNLGLGYTNFEYDSFNMIDGVRVYKERSKSKNFWGPTQVGVNLIWTIGGNK